MSVISEEKLSKIKEDIKSEFNRWNHKPRFGLFSYTSSRPFFSEGEQRPATSKNKQTKDEKGSVKLEPKNFYGGTYKSGKLFNKSFSQTGFLSEMDPYIDPCKIINKFRDQGAPKMSRSHSTAFRPSGANKKPIGAPYEYMSDPFDKGNQHIESRPEPKNFMTAPLKKGLGNTTVGHLFSKPPEYIPDPYDRLKESHSMERLNHKKKMGKEAFHLTFSKMYTFTPNRIIYHDPDDLKPKTPKKPEPLNKPPFMPNNPPKKGFNKTINRFPEYMPDPLPELDPQEVREREKQKKEVPWRYNPKGLTVPTPSIKTYNSLYRPRKAEA